MSNHHQFLKLIHTSNSVMLYIDTSSSEIKVGLWRAGRWLVFRSRVAQALECLDELIKEVIDFIGIRLNDLTAVCVNAGPGSVLGIRLAFMYAKTWKAMDAFEHLSIYVVNGMLLMNEMIRSAYVDSIPDQYAIITESRMKRWNLWSPEFDHNDFEEFSADELMHFSNSKCADDFLFFIYNQRNPSKPLSISDNLNIKKVELTIEDFPSVFEKSGLVRMDSELDALRAIGTETDYKKWEGKRHT